MNLAFFYKLCNFPLVQSDAIWGQMWLHNGTKSEALLETSFQFIAMNLTLKRIFHFSFLKLTIFYKLCDFSRILRKVAIWGQLCEIPTSQNMRTPDRSIGWHCFNCWNVFIIATEKKIFMQQEAFSFMRTKIKTSLFLYNVVLCGSIRWQNS